MKRIKDTEELLDKELAQDNPENIPDMYDDNDGSDEIRDARYDWDMMCADMERKEQAERWDR